MGVLYCIKCGARAEADSESAADSKIDHAARSPGKCPGKGNFIVWYPNSKLAGDKQEIVHAKVTDNESRKKEIQQKVSKKYKKY